MAYNIVGPVFGGDKYFRDINLRAVVGTSSEIVGKSIFKNGSVAAIIGPPIAAGGPPPPIGGDWVTGSGDNMVTGSGDNFVFGLE